MVGPASAAHRTQVADRGWLGGIHHFNLTHHDDAYDAMIGWLRSAA